MEQEINYQGRMVNIPEDAGLLSTSGELVFGFVKVDGDWPDLNKVLIQVRGSKKLEVYRDKFIQATQGLQLL